MRLPAQPLEEPRDHGPRSTLKSRFFHSRSRCLRLRYTPADTHLPHSSEGAHGQTTTHFLRRLHCPAPSASTRIPATRGRLTSSQLSPLGWGQRLHDETLAPCFHMTPPLRQCFSLLAAFLLLCLFVTAATSSALSQPCDNTSAPDYSAVHLNADGNIWPPDDIQNNASLRSTLFEHRIAKSAITNCLEMNETIRNHVIDFLDYLEAARAAASEIRDSSIEQSIIWDFRDDESVTLSQLVGRLPKPDLGIPFKSGPLTDKKISWQNLTLGPVVEAERAWFGKPVRFTRVLFPTHTSFRDARFLSRASFTRAVFSGETKFSGVEFCDTARFDRAIFSGSAAFDNLVARGSNSFANATFGDSVSFAAAAFRGSNKFTRASFLSSTTFEGASFSQRLQMTRATFRDHANFTDAKFQEGADLSRNMFLARVTFEGTTFHGPVTFYSTEFAAVDQESPSFDRTTFAGEADFREVRIERLQLSTSALSGETSFRDADIREELNLSELSFPEGLDLRGATIGHLEWSFATVFSSVEGPVDGRQMHLKGANFTNVRFSSAVDFSGTRLGSEDSTVVFHRTTFEKDFNLLHARFRGDAVFLRNKVMGLWNISDANFDESANLCLSFNEAARLKIDRALIGSEASASPGSVHMSLSAPSLGSSPIRGLTILERRYTCRAVDRDSEAYGALIQEQSLASVYAELEQAFHRLGDWVGENEAWYLSAVAARQMTQAKALRVVAVALLDYPSRYGVDLLRALLVSLGLMLGFALLYFVYFTIQIRRGRRPKVVPAKTKGRTGRVRLLLAEPLFGSDHVDGVRLRPLRDSLCLSGRVFFKLGRGTRYPRTKFLLVLVYLEWCVGLYMLLHVLLAVKNSLPFVLAFLAGAS